MILRASRQALRLAIVVALAMTPMWFGVSPASAATWNPPPPIKDDYCGTKWDRAWIPRDDSTGYKIGGVTVGQEKWHPTGGASTVTVVAYNYIDPDKPFTLTFGTESDSSCTEAQDTAWVSVGACNPVTGGSPLTLNYRNVADASGWPRDNARVVVTRWDFRWDTGGVDVATPTSEVTDGASSSVSTFWNGEAIVAGPGTHIISLGVNDGALRQVGTIFVPSCSPRNPVPSGDPSGLGDSKGGKGNNAGSGTSLPRIAFKQAGCTVKVKVINRKGKVAVPYRVVFKPAKGKASVKKGTVKAGGKAVVKRSRFIPPGKAKVVYKVAGKKYKAVKRLNGCG